MVYCECLSANLRFILPLLFIQQYHEIDKVTIVRQNKHLILQEDVMGAIPNQTRFYS